MSDTIQIVRWSLGDGATSGGGLWLPPGRERPDEVLQCSLVHTGIESDLRQAFQPTDPFWYGLWVDSPLSRRQCELLHVLFADVMDAVPRYQKRLEEFVDALQTACRTGEALNVSLAPPGHVDMAWITTFAHCPRCKAEGRLPRWQSSYSTAPIQCRVCGNAYAPAATYSMRRQYFTDVSECRSCGASHRIEEFSEADISLLENQHYYRQFSEELAWLRRIAAFYRRHPGMEGRVKPDFLRAIESDDPEIRDALWASVPFDELQLSPEVVSPAGTCRIWASEDLEVVEYLKTNHFSLQPRWEFVSASIERLRTTIERQSVCCPKCAEPID